MNQTQSPALSPSVPALSRVIRFFEPPAPVEAGAEGQPLEARLQVVEKQLILATLRKHDGNREKAARELGLSRSSLFKRLKDWGITNSDE